MRPAASKIAVAITLLASCIACSSAGPTEAPSTPDATSATVSVTLRAGESQHAGRGLRIGFVGVAADSRCPRGEQCVSAGSATARFWVQPAGSPRQTIELRLGPSPIEGPGPRAALKGAVLLLLRLDPSPVAGRGTTAGDYVATLSVQHGNGEPPDPER